MNVSRFEVAFYVPAHLPNYPEYLAAIADLGAGYVGFGLSLDKMRDAAFIAGLGRELEFRKLRAWAVHSPVGLAVVNSDVHKAMSNNQTVIEFAARLGAKSTVWHFRQILVPGKDPRPVVERIHDLPMDALDSLLREVLPLTCAFAADRAVEINLENLPLLRWSRSSYEILDFIRSVHLPNLGYILDSGHSHCNGEDPAAVIRAAGNLLRDTHLHDNLGSRGFDFSQPGKQSDITPARDLHLIPGLGTVNWIDLIRALRDVNYLRLVAFEEPGIKGHPDQSLRQWARCMKLTLEMWRALEEAASYIPNP